MKHVLKSLAVAGAIFVSGAQAALADQQVAIFAGGYSGVLLIQRTRVDSFVIAVTAIALRFLQPQTRKNLLHRRPKAKRSLIWAKQS